MVTFVRNTGPTPKYLTVRSTDTQQGVTRLIVTEPSGLSKIHCFGGATALHKGTVDLQQELTSHGWTPITSHTVKPKRLARTCGG